MPVIDVYKVMVLVYSFFGRIEGGDGYFIM